MKHLVLSLDSGDTALVDAPVPVASGPFLVVQSRATLVSAGTERMLVEFGQAHLLAKARSQPGKVRQVLDRIRTEGIASTVDAVRAKLSQPIALGYCHAGVVVAAGGEAGPFRPGERVVTNGPHAEYVRVPHTLTARIPDAVSFEAACFVPAAAIGLQGIRLAQPTLGETVVVYGLGLIGLLAVQLLRAQGCRVIGIDLDPGRLRLAERFGATPVDGRAGDPAATVLAETGGVGADAVLLTLSAESDGPIHQAAEMSRKRGRLVLVGRTGLKLAREDFYHRELSFIVSASYGPGRYDPAYENQGRDYPLSLVRWTAQRNFQAVLALMAEGRLTTEELVTHRVRFDAAPAAYQTIVGRGPSLGVVLQYPAQGHSAPPPGAHRVETGIAARTGGKGVAGVIGAGNFAVQTLLPALAAAGCRLRGIASEGGLSAATAARRFGAEVATSDAGQLLEDPDIDTVFVLTRHDTHARLVLDALAAGKHVFVEKPLALTEPDLDLIAEAAGTSGRLVMVGFNRRFAPLAVEVGRRLAGRAGTVSIVATINAGSIPREHWTRQATGGGRIVGEACHWIDLARALVGSPIADLQVTAARDAAGAPVEDIAHLALRFADGSTAVIHYLASGARSFPKERIECFFDGKTMVIDNWRRLRRYGVGGPLFEFAGKVEKGHRAEVAAWLAAVRGQRPVPVPLAELIEVSRWSIRAGQLARGQLGGTQA